MRKPLRFKKKKKPVSLFRFRFFWYGTGFTFLFVFVFWFIVFSSWLEIQELLVEGENEIQEEFLVAEIEKALWKPWFGIPTNSIFLFDAKETKNALSFVFPMILEASFQRQFPHRLILHIQEREQVATWFSLLSDRADEQTGMDILYFAIDKEGIPFKEIKDTDNYVVFSSEDNAVLGQELLAPSLLSTLLEFKRIFEIAGEPMQLSIVAFEIGNNGEVKGVAKEGFKILLDLKEDIQWQETKLRLVLEQKIPLEKRGELEYIDLRFGGQAYLKYKD